MENIEVKIERPDQFCEMTGYECKTAYYQELSIAENFGIQTVKACIRRQLRESMNDYKLLTELVMMVNWRYFRWMDSNPQLAEFYARVYEDLDEYAVDHKTITLEAHLLKGGMKASFPFQHMALSVIPAEHVINNI